MALDRYLAEEICLDHREGLMTRRDALRRLTLMGLSLTAATALIEQATPSADAVTKRTTTTRRPTRTTKPATKPATTKPVATTAAPAATVRAGSGPALATEAITFAGPAGRLRGTFAAAATPVGGVLIIHENRGLTPHFQALPGRFARDGFSSLAVDLASRQGGTDAVADQMPAPLAQARTEDLVADLIAALDELARRTPGANLAVIGFCFGGGMVWNLLGAGDPRLKAAAPFYGVGPTNADFTRSKGTAVLAVYAERDSRRVNADRPAMTAALERAGLTHEVVVFPGVDHAFFNDTGSRYDATQAAAAYDAVLTWFTRHLR